MASPITSPRPPNAVPPLAGSELPALYEDEAEEVWDIGDSDLHTTATELLHVCLRAHLADRPGYRAFSNLNLYYDDKEHEPGRGLPYISPDVMVVCPGRELPEGLASYQIGREGPPPALTIEVLSELTAQQRDLDAKPLIYGSLGVAEYILVDLTDAFLPRPLILKRLQADRTWQDEYDADGGITSRLGFRVLVETDGGLRVIDTATGRRYVRPNEAEREAEARRQAEERIQTLEAELNRLKAAASAKKPTRRRKKK